MVADDGYVSPDLDAEATGAPQAPDARRRAAFARPQADEGDPALAKEVLEALKTVRDPEIPVNLVDLGLIYSFLVRRDGLVHIEMTLTSPACPVGPEILRNAVTALEKVEGISKANVKLVMSPPWTQDKMSDAARDELGFF